MSKLVIVLVGAIILLLLSVVVFPMLLIITVRLSRSGLLFEVHVGLYSGRLRFRIFRYASDAGEIGSDDRGRASFVDLVLHGLGLALHQVKVARHMRESAFPRRLSKRSLMLSVLNMTHRVIGEPGCQCTRFEIHAELGTQDPFWTALAVGLAYAAFGSSQQLLNKPLRFAPSVIPVVELRPSFQSREVTGSFDCIFRISLGYIIAREVAGLVRTRSTPRKVA